MAPVRQRGRGAGAREPVVVCGGGAAGMAAALAAARAGAPVHLLEARPRLGGTVAHALIHTLGGLYDSAGELLHDGLPRDLAEALARADGATRQRRLGRAWVLNVCPNVYQALTGCWIKVEPGITVHVATRVTGVLLERGRIVEVQALGPAGGVRLPARAVVDATGTAAVARCVGPELVQDEGRRAAGGFILCLRGVAPGALAFPRGVGVVRALQRAATDGTLPPACGKAWVDQGVHRDEGYVKLLVPLPAEANGAIPKAVPRAARAAGRAVVAFLKKQPGFAEAVVDRVGEVGVRDGGRVRGEYVLTGADVRQGRRFRDAACRCAWPIEYWDPDEGVALEYLPEGSWYEIPLRSLKVRGVANLWAAGKCLSADGQAQASARVVGTCWAMGEAVGKTAAR